MVRDLTELPVTVKDIISGEELIELKQIADNTNHLVAGRGSTVGGRARRVVLSVCHSPMELDLLTCVDELAGPLDHPRSENTPSRGDAGTHNGLAGR